MTGWVTVCPPPAGIKLPGDWLGDRMSSSGRYRAAADVPLRDPAALQPRSRTAQAGVRLQHLHTGAGGLVPAATRLKPGEDCRLTSQVLKTTESFKLFVILKSLKRLTGRSKGITRAENAIHLQHNEMLGDDLTRGHYPTSPQPKPDPAVHTRPPFPVTRAGSSAGQTCPEAGPRRLMGGYS